MKPDGPDDVMEYEEADIEASELVRVMGAIGRSFPPPAESLLAAVEKDGAVRMRNPGRVLALAALLSLVYGAALVAVLSLRLGLAHLPTAWLIWFGSARFAGFPVLLCTHHRGIIVGAYFRPSQSDGYTVRVEEYVIETLPIDLLEALKRKLQ